MDCGKAVKEVWEWRDAIGKELEHLSPEEQINYLNEKARKACIKYKVKLRKKANVKRRVVSEHLHN